MGDAGRPEVAVVLGDIQGTLLQMVGVTPEKQKGVHRADVD